MKPCSEILADLSMFGAEGPVETSATAQRTRWREPRAASLA
jgi:hypothetical protein